MVVLLSSPAISLVACAREVSANHSSRKLFLTVSATGARKALGKTLSTLEAHVLGHGPIVPVIYLAQEPLRPFTDQRELAASKFY